MSNELNASDKLDIALEIMTERDVEEFGKQCAVAEGKDTEIKFVDYPVAYSFEQARDWLVSGGELWQEDSSDYPNCGGIETVEDLREMFADGLDKTNNVHLVVKIK